MPVITVDAKNYIGGNYNVYDDTRKTLRYMKNTFIDEKNQTLLLGAELISAPYSAGINTVSDPISAMVYGYDFFKKYYEDSLPLNTNVTAAMLTTDVKVREDANTIYYTMPISDIQISGSTVTDFTKEVNYSKILRTPADSNTPNLIKDLNKVRNAYTYLKDTNLKRFKSGTADNDIKLSNYVIDTIEGSSNINKTLTTLADNETVQNIWEVLIKGTVPITNNSPDYNKMKEDIRNFDVVKNDVFVIRRMLLLFEMMANIYISMYLYDMYNLKTSDTDTTKKNNQKLFVKNISNTAQMLINLNETFTKSTEGGDNTRSKIIRKLNEEIRKYLNNSNQINSLDTDIFNLKMDMTSNKSLYEGSAGKSKKVSTYEKTMIAVFVVFIVATLGVSMYPMPKPIKVISILAMLVLVVVFAFVFKFMFNKKLEGFEDGEDFEDMDDEEFEDMDDDEEGFAVGDGEYLINPNTITSVQENSDITSTLTTYNRAFVGEALDYLNITLYLGITLQSSKSYRNMNNTIGREMNYFEQVKTMMDNTNNKLSSGASVNQLDIMISRARANFFIKLGIIIAVCALAYVILGDNARVQPYIFAITGLLILLIVFMYMHEVAKYVHTDGTKFYWTAPSNMSVLDN